MDRTGPDPTSLRLQGDLDQQHRSRQTAPTTVRQTYTPIIYPSTRGPSEAVTMISDAPCPDGLQHGRCSYRTRLRRLSRPDVGCGKHTRQPRRHGVHVGRRHGRGALVGARRSGEQERPPVCNLVERVALLQGQRHGARACGQRDDTAVFERAVPDVEGYAGLRRVRGSDLVGVGGVNGVWFGVPREVGLWTLSVVRVRRRFRFQGARRA
ncbi:hypothetical protein BKA80DRAFT_54341 [Phyllosticta citrichinensis]